MGKGLGFYPQDLPVVFGEGLREGFLGESGRVECDQELLEVDVLDIIQRPNQFGCFWIVVAAFIFDGQCRIFTEHEVQMNLTGQETRFSQSQMPVFTDLKTLLKRHLALEHQNALSQSAVLSVQHFDRGDQARILELCFHRFKQWVSDEAEIVRHKLTRFDTGIH